MDILIEQGEWWVDRQQRRHRIATMDVNHAANTAAMLRRVANHHPAIVHLHSLDLIGRMPDEGYKGLSPADTAEAAERLLSEPPSRWLETTPLMRALRFRASEEQDPFDDPATFCQDWSSAGAS